MASLSDSSVPRPRAGLWSRLSTARRRAAVVTSAALLAAGAGVASSSTASDAPAVSATVAPADEPPPPAVTMVPPVALVSHAEVPTPAAEAPAGTAPVETGDEAVEGEPIGSGKASYYGAELAGNPTASGETFDPSEMTAAHRTLPFGTRLRVTNERTGASVVVRVNDRGPFHGDRVIDVSTAAAKEIGLKRAGTARVSLERLPKKPARG